MSIVRVVFLLLSPLILTTSAYGSSCYDFYKGQKQLEEDKQKFMWEYKGTLASLGICMASCTDQPSSDKAGCYLGVCGTACLFIGFSNCIDVFNKMSSFEKMEKQMKDHGRSQGCLQ